MKAAQILRKKINSPDLTVGVLATFHCWPGLVEILINAGYDYLIIDFEHGPYDAAMAVQTCTLGRLANFPVLIRPPAVESTLIHTTMDLGPAGLLLPYVETAEQLDQVRDAVFLPPRGKRRPGGAGCHWVSGVDYDNWKKEVEDDLIILPQVESRIGVQNADALAAHEVTTAIAVGPYDLSADMGLCWQPDHPELMKAIETVRAAGKKAGKNTWMNGDAHDMKAHGFNFICTVEPSFFLQSALADQLKSIRQGKAPGK